MPKRRLLACAVAALVLASPAAALAATHAGHSHKVSGHVLSINAKRHTLRLRLRHAARGAHAAAAAGGPVIVVSFGNATVSGPNGAVAVGDDVTVTTQTSSGQTTVASSIQVIGQPNGGDAGKGAATPGQVTAVDPTAGTLTLSVLRADAQGNTSEASVIVTVGSNTILAVSDTNGDGAITIADIKPGDHLVVFTNDATANPMVAIGILDASHTGGDHQGGDGGTRPSEVPGTVATVDSGGTYLTIAVTDGALKGQQLGVKITPQTSFGGEDSNGDGSFGVADIAVGDQLVVYTAAVTPGSVVAVGIVDRTTHATSVPPAAPTPAPAQKLRFGGTVTDVRGDGLTVAVSSDGPLSGHSVIVSIGASTSFETGHGTGSGTANLAYISVGDAVEIYTTSESTSPVVAVGVRDDSVPTGSQSSSVVAA